MNDLSIIILAAGKGTRMKSAAPKVLHELAGEPMLQHVVNTARKLDPLQIIIVVGHRRDLVEQKLSGQNIEWSIQEEQSGTGHAVKVAMPLVKAKRVLILYGDVPLIRVETLETILKGLSDAPLAVLTATMSDPTGYGRIIRDSNGHIAKIVEQKDASREECLIKEVNTGFIAAHTPFLKLALASLKNNNAQQEYYLTDVVEYCVNSGQSVSSITTSDISEISGVNSRSQLNKLERIFQEMVALSLMESGVTLMDASRIDIRGELQAGEDCIIDVGCVFEGNVTLGNNVRIEANCVIKNAVICDDVVVKAFSYFEDVVIGLSSSVGPYSRLRPGTVLHAHTHVGNFVEIKKSIIGIGSKVNHLSYIGDAEVGSHANIGAGTITCNYDGANKHKTIIGDGVFIGSNTALVAPINVGDGATVGAGSTLSEDVAAGTLAFTRAIVRLIPEWARPKKRL